MKGTVNECVGCETCVGCGARHTPCIRCDNCQDVCDTVYRYEGSDLCKGCAVETAVQLWNDLFLCDKLSFLQIDRDEFATEYGAEVAVDEVFNDLTDDEQIDLFDEIEEV